MAEEAASTPVSLCEGKQRRESRHELPDPAIREEPYDLRHAAERSPYMTYEEAARYCRCSRVTIYRAVKAGRLKASGPGSIVRFARTELIRWMDSRK